MMLTFDQHFHLDIHYRKLGININLICAVMRFDFLVVDNLKIRDLFCFSVSLKKATLLHWYCNTWNQVTDRR